MDTDTTPPRLKTGGVVASANKMSCANVCTTCKTFPAGVSMTCRRGNREPEKKKMKRNKITKPIDAVPQTIDGTDIAYEDTQVGDVLLIGQARCTITEIGDHHKPDRMILRLQTEVGKYNRNVPRRNLCHLIKRQQD